MAKKSYTVNSPVRVNNRTYLVGAHLQCEESDIEGIEDCVTPGKPKPASVEEVNPSAEAEAAAAAEAQALAEAEAQALADAAAGK